MSHYLLLEIKRLEINLGKGKTGRKLEDFKLTKVKNSLGFDQPDLNLELVLA